MKQHSGGDSSSGLSAAAVAAWCDPNQTTALSFGDAVHAFHALGPRVRFIKTLPFGARMLDAGAGDGGGMILRDWPAPGRPDVQMFAWAGEASPGFTAYAGCEIGWWPSEPPGFGGMRFDAVFCCNFIEHIDEPLVFIEYVIGLLAPKGRIFLEWPRPESVVLPTVGELARFGVHVTTGSYHDDSTHRCEPPPLCDVMTTLQDHGMRIVEQGISGVPFIDRQVAIHARQNADLTAMTLAYWSFSGWCQFVSAERL